jgi:hypothetical protein
LNRSAELNRLTLPKELVREPEVVKAGEVLERMGLNSEEREIYEGEVKRRMVDSIQLQTAEERGKQQGMQQGMRMNARNVVLRLLARRIGEVPVSISSRLERLNAEALDDLAVDSLDFVNYVDVENWLTRQLARLRRAVSILIDNACPRRYTFGQWKSDRNPVSTTP